MVEVHWGMGEGGWGKGGGVEGGTRFGLSFFVRKGSPSIDGLSRMRKIVSCVDAGGPGGSEEGREGDTLLPHARDSS